MTFAEREARIRERMRIQFHRNRDANAFVARGVPVDQACIFAELDAEDFELDQENIPDAHMPTPAEIAEITEGIKSGEIVFGRLKGPHADHRELYRFNQSIEPDEFEAAGELAEDACDDPDWLYSGGPRR